jgi:hypothetical protein
VASVCWGQQQPVRQPLGDQPRNEDVPETAAVELTLSAVFGRPVGKALAVLKAIGPPKQYRQSGETIRFEKVPFGLYDLEIQAAGFSTRRERIEIYQPEVHLWFGLFVSPLHGDQRPEITGSIMPHETNPKDLWVRLVPLLGSDFVEDRVGPSGEFRLTGVHPGRYVLLVFNQEKLLMTQPVDFPGGKLALNLDVSK